MTTAEAGELLQERRGHRRNVIRMAAMYTPGFIVVLVLLSISLWSIVQGSFGALLPAIILGLVSVALGFQAIASLRDLRAQPATTTGMVRRAWTKGMVLGFIRTHYILVGKSVFDVSAVAYAQLQEDDRVEIQHWPHTKTVISVRKLRRQGPSDSQRDERIARAFEPKPEEFIMPDVTDAMMSTQYGGLWWGKLRDAFWRRWRR